MEVLISSMYVQFNLIVNQFLTSMCAFSNQTQIYAFHQTKKRFGIIRKRRPLLATSYGWLCIIDILLINPVIVCIGNNDEDYIINESINLFISDLFSMINSLILLTLELLILIRLWLLVFDHNFGLANVDRVWRETINANEISFWIKYKKTFGNLKYLLLIMFIFLFVCIITFIIIELIMIDTYQYWNMTHLHQTIQSILSIICIVAIILLLRLFDGLIDPYAIKKEMKCLIVIMLLFTITSLIIAHFIPFSDNIIQFSQHLCVIAYFLSMTFFQVSIMFLVQGV